MNDHHNLKDQEDPNLANNPINEKSEVTPWSVKGKIDYAKLVKDFGTELITDELKLRFERLIGKPLHPWIKRGIFFSHRGLSTLLDSYEKKEPIFIYTGRGPSNEMHLGHMVPFVFAKWLQDVLDCPVIIQISDEEKFYFKNLPFEDVYNLGFKNARDIAAFGFNPAKTFVFSNRDYRISHPEYEVFVSNMKKHVSTKQISKVFGFGEAIKDSDGNDQYVYKEDITVGMMDWPIYQTAAAFSEAFPEIFGNKQAQCIVSYAIDQDNYFRLARDVASKMRLKKPCSIISVFLDPITGSGKMSSSEGQEATIFLTDSPATIKKKIKKYAFSGSRGTGSLADHKMLGGDVEKDIPCKYLRYFEMDDLKYKSILEGFSKGEITCSQTKDALIEKLTEVILEHQRRRDDVTEDSVKELYRIKKMF